MARGDDGPRLVVEKHRVRADGEDARQLVRDHHHRRAEAVAQLEDQIVEPPRADRIQAGRGLVEEEDVGIERYRARQAGPLTHPAADLGRIELLEAGESDQRELERDELSDRGRR